MKTTADPDYRHCVVLLIELVDELRELRAARSDLTFTQLIADAVPQSEELAEVARHLDRYSSTEVDAELERLWAGVLGPAKPIEETQGETQ